MRSLILKNSVLNALVAVIYIGLVALFVTKGKDFFGAFEANHPALIAMSMLLLLVISVAVMGITIFGRPVMWYLDGNKKEAVLLALNTIGFLIIFGIIIFSAAILTSI
jgi:hypothetical protein